MTSHEHEKVSLMLMICHIMFMTSHVTLMLTVSKKELQDSCVGYKALSKDPQGTLEKSNN